MKVLVEAIKADADIVYQQLVLMWKMRKERESNITF